MKKCVWTSMLLLLISFAIFIGPSEEMAQYSFIPTDEPAISTVDTIANTDVITESVQTIIQKWQPALLFPPTNTTHILTEKFVPVMFIKPVFCLGENTGFICAVHHQSNYLP